jgi:hypothetical protein
MVLLNGGHNSFYNKIMSKHITINGQTYASVEEMPPGVRKQYEEAMRLLASEATGDAGDVNLTTTGNSSGGHTSKTYRTVTSTRFKVNGKEYDRWEDIPLAVRTAMEVAGMGPHHQAQGVVPKRQDDRVAAELAKYDSKSGGVTMSVGALIVLLTIAVAGGIFIGYKLMH